MVVGVKQRQLANIWQQIIKYIYKNNATIWIKSASNLVESHVNKSALVE
jgi:hypothetical protein